MWLFPSRISRGFLEFTPMMDEVYMATLLSEIRQQMLMWRQGWGFDEVADNLLREIEEALKGRKP